ncbi:MAG TPA: DNA polymerase III subunit gamma and tau [Trebonia sp.]|jgi:DNA polymerase-3 subunit gamma/tau|nr:DNA polymerase III subunit gamma and tau [Trebonia sp.]
MAEDTKSSGGLALYRKYRPATFAEVRGQEHVTEPLRQALRSGRINHAYLFSGPRGCGKTSSARILARSLNCVEGPTPDPCGVCESCIALAPSGPGSIDVIEIDAASHGGVDDARDLRERAFYAPVSGRYKIYIIDEAHMVTSQGFNALLKLVEEPPSHLKFIFATTEPDKVIATIRSRTHHYPFRLMPPSVMSGLLTDILNDEGVPFEPPVIPLVVQAGAGSARDSLSILDQLLAGSDENGIRYDRAVALLGYTDASLLDEIVSAFAAGDGAGVFRVVNKVIEGGHEPRRFAADMLDRLRDLIVLASVPDAISTGLLNVPPDRADTLTEQAAWGPAQLTRAADIVSNGLDQMRGATSPRLLLELMCAQVLLPAAATDERSVLARLERLETGYPARAQVSPQVPPPVHQAPTAVPAPAAPSAPTAPAPAPAPQAAPVPASQAAPVPMASVPDADDSPASHRGASPSGARSEARATSVAERREDGAPQRPGGERGVTADSLRQDWHSVLEMIKTKRRVAWMMLQNASVVSVEENVLMLRFPRQGDVKGFTSGQYDEMLKQALHARYGVNLVVRAISGPDTGPGGPVARGPAPAPAAPQSSPASPAPAAPSGPGPDSHAGNGSGPGYGQGAGSSAPAPPESAAPFDVPEPAPVPGPAAVSASVPAAQPPVAQAVSSASRPDDVPFPSDDDFDPDAEENVSAPISAELTGMALVQRELGGEIIAEYED